MPGVAFVVNGSLVRGGGHLLALCREAAARYGWRAEVFVTDKAEAGVSAANGAALDGIDLVVAVGGDGTVRGCAEGLAGSGVPLGIVPHGTANLLARSLGIPAHPRAALAAAVDPDGPARLIDLAVADDEVPFTAMAGMGLDAAVVAGTRLKHQFGWLAYAMSGAVHLTLPPSTFSIRLDGGAPVERTARSVVGVLAPQGPFGWPRVAARVLARSQHQDRMLERFQARKVEISATARLPREVDGELVTAGHSLTVTVVPSALTVRMPGL